MNPVSTRPAMKSAWPAARARKPALVSHRPDLDLATGLGQLCRRLSSVARVDNELGDHRIVMRGDFTAFLDAAVDPDVVRQAQVFQSSD